MEAAAENVIGTAAELFGMEVGDIPTDIPMYMGTPNVGFYFACLLSKEISTGEWEKDGQKKSTPQTDAKIWFIGGRPGEPVNSVYEMNHMRYAKHDAMRNLEPGDLFVAHIYKRKGTDNRTYDEMAVMSLDDVRVAAETMAERATLGE